MDGLLLIAAYLFNVSVWSIYGLVWLVVVLICLLVLDVCFVICCWLDVGN